MFAVSGSCSHSSLEAPEGLSGLSLASEGKQALTDSFTSPSRTFILASYSVSASCWNCKDSKDHHLAQEGPPAYTPSPGEQSKMTWDSVCSECSGDWGGGVGHWSPSGSLSGEWALTKQRDLQSCLMTGPEDPIGTGAWGPMVREEPPSPTS